MTELEKLRRVLAEAKYDPVMNGCRPLDISREEMDAAIEQWQRLRAKSAT